MDPISTSMPPRSHPDCKLSTSTLNTTSHIAPISPHSYIYIKIASCSGYIVHVQSALVAGDLAGRKSLQVFGHPSHFCRERAKCLGGQAEVWCSPYEKYRFHVDARSTRLCSGKPVGMFLWFIFVMPSTTSPFLLYSKTPFLLFRCPISSIFHISVPLNKQTYCS